MSTKLAVTGGIACGKSYFLTQLSKHLGGDVFSCDEAVSNLLTEQEIVAKLTSCVGDSILDGDGNINRPVLRDAIFESPVLRKKVEDVLHPAVLKEAKTFYDESQSAFLIVEVPLLYEVDFPIQRDFDIVIGCSEETQLDRLTGIRQLDRLLAVKILSAQLSIQQKINLSDFTVWNDGTKEAFDDQILSISKLLTANSIKA